MAMVSKAVGARQAPVKLIGYVKDVKREKGFGFITHTATGVDHFFHRTALVDPTAWDGIAVGDDVEFTQEDSTRGPRAVAVDLV